MKSSPHQKNQSTKKISGERQKTVDVLQEKENFNSLHRVICHVLSIIRYHREPTASIARGRGGEWRETRKLTIKVKTRSLEIFIGHTHIFQTTSRVVHQTFAASLTKTFQNHANPDFFYYTQYLFLGCSDLFHFVIVVFSAV